MPFEIQGLNFMMKHLETGDGCELLHKHGAVECVVQVSTYPINKPKREIQLYCVSILRKLLDCNYTRESIINKDVRVLRLAFSIGHNHIDSMAHIEQATACVMQCAQVHTVLSTLLTLCSHSTFNTFILLQSNLYLIL